MLSVDEEQMSGIVWKQTSIFAIVKLIRRPTAQHSPNTDDYWVIEVVSMVRIVSLNPYHLMVVICRVSIF